MTVIIVDHVVFILLYDIFLSTLHLLPFLHFTVVSLTGPAARFRRQGGFEMNHCLAVKQYSRSSADQEEPLPHELRTPAALLRTMDYLVTHVTDCESRDTGDWWVVVEGRGAGGGTVYGREQAAAGGGDVCEAVSHLRGSASRSSSGLCFPSRVNEWQLLNCISLRIILSFLWSYHLTSILSVSVDHCCLPYLVDGSHHFLTDPINRGRLGERCLQSTTLTPCGLARPMTNPWPCPPRFHFIWDRTRGIRKDITQQQLTDEVSVALVEKCARFHVHCAAALCELSRDMFDQKINNENLTKCLQVGDGPADGQRCNTPTRPSRGCTFAGGDLPF